MILHYILIGLLFISSATATTIDIYYPQDNITTLIYYAEDQGYNTTIANNITGDITAIVVQEEIEYVNIIASPHVMIAPIFGLIMVIIVITFIIFFVKAVKQLWRH